MIIKFKSITIQGFMSIGNAKVELSDKGLVLIKGKNEFESKSESNGSGKSAIFESIIWTLTGSTSRNSSNVVNRYTNTGTCCEVDLDVDSTNYVIRRTDSHSQYGSSLTIIKNGEDISGNTRTKSKKILESELPKLTYDMLTSIIILSQGLPSRLSSLSPTRRKARLEELSSAEYYLEELSSKLSQASKRISEDKISALSAISKCEGEISVNKRNIDDAQSKIDKMNSESSSTVDEKEYLECKAKVDEASSKISTISAETKTISDNMNGLLSTLREISYTKSNITSRLTQIGQLYAQVSTGMCPTCQRPMDDPSKLEELRNGYLNESVQLKTQLSEILNRESELSNNVKSYESQLESANSTISELYSTVSSLQPKIVEYEKNSKPKDVMEYLHDTITTGLESIRSAEDSLEVHKEELNRVTQESDIYNYINKSMTKKFRSFLLEGTIDYLNSKCEMYSKSLFVNQGIVKLVINGNNIDIMLGDDTYFEDLSGGESRRVDLVVQLALRDLAKNESGFSSNILVIDEALDYLDSLGVESVIELIETKSDDIESILVVTHKTDVKLPYDDVWLVTKNRDRVSHVS